MRILIIGAEGTVGKAAMAALSPRHDVITAGRNSGTERVDVADEGSVKTLFARVGKVDAIVSTAGHVHFGLMATMTGEQFKSGLLDKLLGQVNVALIGQNFLNDHGSITLTSGVLNRDPIRKGANAAAVNGALDAFVKSAAIELTRGCRINVVSPGVLEESAQKYDGFFPGHETVTSARTGLGFVKSVEGALTGQVIIVA